MSLPIQAQLDPTPKGFKLLWKIPAYSCFRDLDIIRQTDSGAAFINATTKYCDTGLVGGEIGIWVDSKGDAVYMNPSPDRVESEILYLSDNKIVFVNSPLANPMTTQRGGRIYLTEVIKSGGVVRTNTSELSGEYYINNQYSMLAANSNSRIFLSLKDNQQWSPFRWLYAYTVDSSAGSGGETGSGLSQYIKIRNDPVDQYGILGGSVEFKVDVASSIPVTYQWQKDGKDLSGAASTSLRIDKIATLNSGLYNLIIKSAFGSVTSSPAKMMLVNLPVVSFGTNNLAARVRDSLTIAPNILSDGPVAYLWYKDGIPLNNQTQSFIKYDDVAEIDKGVYQLEVTNLAGRIRSSGVSLTTSMPFGNVMWTTPVMFGSSIRGVAVGNNDNVIYSQFDQSQKIISTDPISGKPKWKCDLGQIQINRILVGLDGLIYALSGFNIVGNIFAIHPNSGSILWQKEIREPNSWVSIHGVSIGGNGMINIGYRLERFPDPSISKMAAFDPKNGNNIWTKEIKSVSMIFPITLSDGGLLLGGGVDNFGAVKLDQITGDAKKQYQVERGLYLEAVGGDETFYCVNHNNVIAVNSTTGVVLWEYSTGGNVSAPIVGNNGVVYFGSADNNVYALNGKTGAKVWQYETKGKVATPALGADGNIYVASSDSNLYAINCKTGIKVWDHAIDVGVENSIEVMPECPFLGLNGLIYIKVNSITAGAGGAGILNSRLLGIYCGSNGLEKSPWPRENANNANTRQINAGFGPLMIIYSPQSGLNLNIPVSPDFDTILEYSTNLNQWSEQQRFSRQPTVQSVIVPLKMDQTKSMEYWRTRNQ